MVDNKCPGEQVIVKKENFKAKIMLYHIIFKESLQKCKYSLQAYSEIWNPEVSLTKTKCVIFSKGILKYEKQEPIFYGGKAINYVSYFKYLGVEFSQNCEFKKVKQERILRQEIQYLALEEYFVQMDVSPLNYRYHYLIQKFYPY